MGAAAPDESANASVPRASVLGFEVADITAYECARIAMSWIRAPGPCRTLACLNPHSIECARRDNEARHALEQADLLVPDGIGVLMAARLLRRRLQGRLTGSDVFRAVHRALEDQAGSVFLLGSHEVVLRRLAERLERTHPGVRVVGTLSPPFQERFSDTEEAAMVTAVNRSNADVLWVGMTAPKQECWLQRNRSRLQVPFAASVGAVFDYVAGTVRRAPPFVRGVGLEWLYRLGQEPARLWRRSLVSMPRFAWHVAQDAARPSRARRDYT